MMKKNKYLIVGLGNPGTKYQHTRHNVGFDAVDLLMKKMSLRDEKKKFSSIMYIDKHDDDIIYIIKPQTFMNNSGAAVAKVMFFYRIKPENIIVIYDDMDIDIGKIRIRKKGSGGTHNGMKSIISHIRSYDFPRIRIGIGKPRKGMDTVNFVLGKETGENKKMVDAAIENAANAAFSIVKNGIDKTMQQFNG
ncbi:MAG: aminoacyl-tRNA hydrolase [Eubacteriales bacterium]